MTRPQIVRAGEHFLYNSMRYYHTDNEPLDTLDLQDQTSPTAQEHRKPTLSSAHGVAPHQAAELRHVQEERHIEEENLSQAWHDANDLSEEPPSDDEAVLTANTNGVNGNQHDGHPNNQNGSQNPSQNGSQNGTDGDTDMHDAEADDNLDDDMMDKISSSPSISDGNYLHSFAQNLSNEMSIMMSHQAPTASMSRRIRTCNQEAPNDSSSPSSGSSTCSLKRRIAISKIPGTPVVSCYEDRIFSDNANPNSWIQDDDNASSSPFISSPEHFPLGMMQETDSPSTDYHRTGECSKPRIPIDSIDDYSDDSQLTAPHNLNETSNATMPSKVETDDQTSEQLLAAPQGLVQSESDIAIASHLLPLDDPLLDDLDDMQPPPPPTIFSAIEAAKHSGSNEEDWETESEDSFYQGSNCSHDSFLGQENDDDTEFLSDPSRVLMGWGGECLRETEDIDFEFVYALHTFVATVEGQANATKGDTMVLLDDSNSYWWLVRVVKDSTIGYLPAEHIETPTERLARLNKHRNVDVSSLKHDSIFSNSDNGQLSAPMLGDSTEKSKNYLKNAMRRRNAKKVQFGGQSYVEASEHEYSSDEDEDGEKVYTNGEGWFSDDSSLSSTSSSSDGESDYGDSVETEHANDDKGPTSDDTNGNASAQDQKDDDIAVAPLKIRSAKDRRSPSPDKKNAGDDDDDDELRRQGVDQSRQSDDSFERQGRLKLRKFSSLEQLKLRFFSGRSRLGTIRNTDSFFKDEATETRKITLTPGLLRDDGAVVRSIDGRERGGSFEILDTGKTSFDKARDDKKKKDKKPGMLSGLFKKKDKKPKDIKEIPSPQKQSEELSRDSPTTESESSSPTPTPNNLLPQRKPSNGKLQKTPPGSSPISPSSPTQQLNGGLRPLVLPSEQAQRDTQATTPIGSDTNTPRATSPQNLATSTSQEKPTLRLRTTDASADVLNDLTNKVRSPSETKREKVKKASTRQALDVDSSPEENSGTNPFADPEEAQKQTTHEDNGGRLSESPVQITSADAVPDNEPPALVGDSTSNSSADELASLRSSPSPQQQNASGTAADSAVHQTAAPLLSPHGATTDSLPPTSPHSPQQRSPSSPLPPSRSPPPQPRSSPLPPTPTTHTPLSAQPHLTPSTARNNSTASTSSAAAPPSRTPSAATATWNDATLREYLDDAAQRDTKALLQLVYDTSGVVPVAADHPLIADLFLDERKAVREMGAELDGLLMGWLGRKRLGGVTPGGGRAG